MRLSLRNALINLTIDGLINDKKKLEAFVLVDADDTLAHGWISNRLSYHQCQRETICHGHYLLAVHTGLEMQVLEDSIECKCVYLCMSVSLCYRHACSWISNRLSYDQYWRETICHGHYLLAVHTGLEMQVLEDTTTYI
jgi:hydrogenase maturation factor